MSPGAVPPAQLQAPPPLLPFDPTLDRTFTSRDTLRLYFKVVQRAARPVTATISALTAGGTIATTFERPLGGSRQPSLDISLPLAQLAPGAYRLQVKVSDGAVSDRREIGFVVK